MRAYKNQSNEQIRILLVVDDQIFASFVSCLLNDLGFGVAGVVSSASEAAAIAQSERLDLALIDIRRGGPTVGIEVTRILSGDFGVPTVFLTRSADDKRKTEARDSLSGDASLRPSQALNAVEEALKNLPG